MADGRERTAAEREAARRERERRRAGRPDDGESFVDYAALEDGDDPAPAARPAPPAPAAPAAPAAPPPAVPAPVVPPPVAPPPGAQAAPAEDDIEDEHEIGEDGASERPSGTRRISGVRPRTPGPSTSRRRPSPRPRRRASPHSRAYSWLGRFVALLVLVIVAVLVWFAVKLYQPFGTSPHGQVTVVVPTHASADQIGTLLAREGVVPSGFFFDLRATLDGDRSRLLAGTYDLRQGMSYSAVLTKLTTPPPAAKTSPVTITPGHTRAQVAKLLRSQGIKGNYLAATRSSPILDPRSYGASRKVASLEGFLFPDTFSLVDPIKVSALVADQLRDFKQRFATVNLSYARAHHLTPYDVLIIASMIEAEAASSRDRPLIASVIYNRLADGMMLQFDSTTRYATGNFTRPLTVSELHSSSPYNTHTHLGLPPTPIDSPSLASIQAAAHPAQTHYLYFFTKPCNAGGSVFTSTYSRFEYLLAADRRNHC